MTIPVVFTHRGPQDYVGIAVEQAKRYGNYVVLLGNEENAHLDVEHHDNADYWHGADVFERLYKHMSGNHRELELYCFQIYFVARNLALEKGWDKIFLIDSDVLLYCNVTEEERKLGEYDLAVSICKNQWKYRWSACLHNSFWKVKTLIDMCNFLIETYNGGDLMAKLEEKWAWHQANGIPGGVCDMTLLWFFCQDRNVVNLSEVRDGATWDDNINIPENYLPDEYLMKNGHKFIDTRAEPGPHLLYANGPQLIRANALHFQGQAKRLMEEYAR